MPKRYNQPCPVAKTLEVIGDRWTLLVVRDLLRGTRRFQDLLGSLPGIAPNILSARLKLMEEHGLIKRSFYSDHPPRAEYALTDQGRELGMVVGALAAWGARHVHQRARLVHAGCGHPVSARLLLPGLQGKGCRGSGRRGHAGSSSSRNSSTARLKASGWSRLPKWPAGESSTKRDVRDPSAPSRAWARARGPRRRRRAGSAREISGSRSVM